MASLGTLLLDSVPPEIGAYAKPALVTLAPFFAEFLGTLFVTLTFGFNILSGEWLWMPTSVGFAVMVAMYACADISGGHLNPALSIAFGLCRKMTWRRISGYILAQVLAGIVGAFLSDELSVKGRSISVGPNVGFDMLDAGICEVVYSAMTCFVALNTMASKRNNRNHRNEYFALAVGMVVVTAGYSSQQISGAFFNPAITLGFSVLGKKKGFSAKSELTWGALYIGFQAVGALGATILFFMVRPEELQAFGVTGRGCGHVLGVVCPGCCGRDSDKDEESVEEAQAAAAEEASLGAGASPWPARLLGEFIGTYAIVLTYGLSTICIYIANGGTLQTGAQANPSNSTMMMVNSTNATLTSQALQANSATSLAFQQSTVAWATGAAVLSMVYALGSASGAHFNPAVTLSVVLSGRGVCGVAEGLTTIAIQFGAAIAAALTYVCVHRGRGRHLRVKDLGPQPGYGWDSVFIGETLFTMTVALVYLCMMTVKSARYSKRPTVHSFQFGYAIGLCVIAGGFAMEGISGGTLNPAVTLGHEAGNFLSSGFQLSNRPHVTVLYTIYEALGGILAALLFAAMHPLEYKKDPLLEG